jgi:hypothetical protein
MPLGDDNKKCNCNSKMRGSLRCAVHGKTVNSFGRDDDAFGVWKKDDGNSRGKDNSRFPSGMTTRKTNAVITEGLGGDNKKDEGVGR